jgi:pyruvyltransferase
VNYKLENQKRLLNLLKSSYEVSPDIVTYNNCVPLTYWTYTENFGDLLSPWLFKKISGKDVVHNKGASLSYVGIGSILNHGTDNSVYWGTGSFGTESKSQVPVNARYHAVRGPLTRAKIKSHGVDCPKVYGDPALLTPMYYWPDIKPEYELGVVLRWSEKKWLDRDFGAGVKKIFLKTSNIEQVISEILSCKRILTSSLHGLIIADAYGIPNAWLESGTPKGAEFKYYDYFLTVNKVRASFSYDMSHGSLNLLDLLSEFDFDARAIEFDYVSLLDSCPLLVKK